MLILARKRGWWLVALVLAADIIIAAFVGDRLVRWELEQIREAW